jgi:L-alanine-DL-glutamate epimerase-like enolase superfamily enzyme
MRMPALSTSRSAGLDATVEAVEAAAYTIPTDAPESDGTIEWHSTTIVVVCVWAADRVGLGYTYADAGAASLVRRTLREVVVGSRCGDVERVFVRMVQACRNLGRPGIASGAISAVDTALWDLKARLLELPLVTLLGAVRESVALYGSGGFTSYSIERLQAQLAGWTEAGFTAVKMKIGRHPQADLVRVRAAREAIGQAPQLYVDANGAYDVKEALAQAHAFVPFGVTWFEEPVSSDNLAALRLLRRRMPPPIEVAAGEYGYDVIYFRRMLEAGAVDVLQADATRCGGITGLLKVGALGDAFDVPLSAHTAPSVHAHVCCAIPRLRNLEYFHDHARIEQMLFDGVLQPSNGTLTPDRSRPGLGLTFRRSDAERFVIT